MRFVRNDRFYNAPGFWAHLGFIVATAALVLMHFFVKLTPEEQARATQAKTQHAQQVEAACNDAKATKKSLLAQGKTSLAQAIDMEKVCQPDVVAARPFFIFTGAYLAVGALILGGMVLLALCFVG